MTSDRGLDLAHGARTALRANASAYAYSVFITSCLGVVNTVVGDVTVPRIFLFLGGVTVAFASSGRSLWGPDGRAVGAPGRGCGGSAVRCAGLQDVSISARVQVLRTRTRGRRMTRGPRRGRHRSR